MAASNILFEIPEHEGNMCDRTRIARRGLQGTPGVAKRFAAMCLQVPHSTNGGEMVMAKRRKRESGAETRIALDALLEEIQRRLDALLTIAL